MENVQILVEWKSRLRSWGYEPVLCSVDAKWGLDTLNFILRDKTSVIVGPSGVGKSSLINALRGNRHVPGVAEEDNWFERLTFSHINVYALLGGLPLVRSIICNKKDSHYTTKAKNPNACAQPEFAEMGENNYALGILGAELVVPLQMEDLAHR
ncbi:uncharacterized protein Fot_15176 [Forsythia ovata]|uniref:EngC GTPase domain-containing protein n=1 Tax=Forsythia ovata TaxID=205694 RepID=A0ABD1WAZ9_9LAMI